MNQSEKNSIRTAEKITLINWLRKFGSRFQLGFVVTDPHKGKDKIVFSNDAFMKISGYSFKEIKGKNLQFLHGERTNMNVVHEIDRKLKNAVHANAELLHYRKDGTPFWGELVIQPLVNGKGETLFIASYIIDITRRKTDESLLDLTKQIFKGINDGEELSTLLQKICTVAESYCSTGSSCSIHFNDENGVWTANRTYPISNKQIQEIIHKVGKEKGYIKDEIICIEDIEGVMGRKLTTKVSEELNFKSSWILSMGDEDASQNDFFAVFNKNGGTPNEFQTGFIHSLVPIIRMAKTYYEQRKQYLILAFTNPETGLPNNHAFVRKLEAKLDTGGPCFVAVILPGEFSQIVDLYGRGAADELFIQLSKRIEKVGRGKENFIGRFSSSSLVLMNDYIEEGNSEFYIPELQKVVAKPFVISNHEIFLTLKIGVAISSEEPISAEELMRRADFAVTEAMKLPGSVMKLYKNDTNQEIIQDIKISNELTKALANDDLDVYLQPKVDLESGAIVSFEALARWYCPVLGQVPPSIFIPVAENSGKIITLEIIIIKKVLSWIQTRLRSGANVFQVAINISVNHFFHATFVSRLLGLIHEYDIPSKYIRLEITESIGLVDYPGAKVIFEQLKEAGFDISIDDFGVGFSSLSYLAQLKVNELKIDRSFVQALDEPETRAVVMTIIQLAKNLGLSTVAEGIEEKRHIDILLSLGCTIGQGFYYYKPMPLAEASLLLDGEKM
ncbi:EAL domain-containing protein [Sporosarcina sp. FA9]|uniref:putative bifunctional diguanylate cyclase/phosphodiesterase n=1 Tax=Sporosarcina sp. FA9 TaxID=3413030 RepID=UPI003F6590A1